MLTFLKARGLAARCTRSGLHLWSLVASVQNRETRSFAALKPGILASSRATRAVRHSLSKLCCLVDIKNLPFQVPTFFNKRTKQLGECTRSVLVNWCCLTGYNFTFYIIPSDKLLESTTAGLETAALILVSEADFSTSAVYSLDLTHDMLACARERLTLTVFHL